MYPTDPIKRLECDQWLFLGRPVYNSFATIWPVLVRLGEEVTRAKEHYDGVLRDMLGMYDKRLSDHEFVIGDYSIADVACYADIHIHGVNDIGLDEYPNIQRWHNAIEARPAVNKAWTPFA